MHVGVKDHKSCTEPTTEGQSRVNGFGADDLMANLVT